MVLFCTDKVACEEACRAAQSVYTRCAVGDVKQPVELLVSLPEREPVSHTPDTGHANIQTHTHAHRYTDRLRRRTFFSDKPCCQKHCQGSEARAYSACLHLDDGQRGNLIVTYELLIFCKGTSVVYQ
ncbi:uncharacterized [Tachysurus ichikawai]